MVVLTPPMHDDIIGPLVFLAGPIQGADDWQSEAIRMFQARAPEVHVANPRRATRFEGEFAAELYAEQVDWETKHLRRAAHHGVIMFWLAKEAVHKCERAYAQTTRFELAEWKMRHERDGAKLVIGIEPGFTGARYIRRRMAQDCPGVPIVDSLQDAVKEALALAR